jgi:hypothetical protein
MTNGITYAQIFHTKAFQNKQKIGVFWYAIEPSGNPVDVPSRVARFFSVQHTKTGKIYQMSIKCTYQLARK